MVSFDRLRRPDGNGDHMIAITMAITAVTTLASTPAETVVPTSARAMTSASAMAEWMGNGHDSGG